MGLRKWWGRLLGDQDRLAREEDAIRNTSGPDGPARLEDFEELKDDIQVKEYDFAGEQSVEEDEEAR